MLLTCMEKKLCIDLGLKTGRGWFLKFIFDPNYFRTEKMYSSRLTGVGLILLAAYFSKLTFSSNRT
jgi:hypothetical protein